MSTHLAAVNRILGSHAFLDEGMPGLAHHGLPAGFFDNINGVPGQARVMDDSRIRLLGQERIRQKADNIVSLDKLALLIEEKAAIEITVPGEAQPCPIGQHRIPCNPTVFWQQRVGYTIWESAIRLMTYLANLERQLLFEEIKYRTCTPVSGIGYDLEWPQYGRVDVAEQVSEVSDAMLIWRDGSDSTRGIKASLFGKLADHIKAAVATDRPAFFTHQLHTIVIGRVVAGRHHDPAVGPGIRGCEIDFFGAA